MLPYATYRLQLNGQFTLQQAIQWIPYLHSLGISHCYLSPILKAKKGSLHGYDIVDHNQINPEIGSEDDLRAFCKTLQAHGMGLICDIVPNHMYIMDSSNKWWEDVLENGQSSPYARYFDIDWLTPHKDIRHKVLLPILDDQYGQVLERQRLSLIYREGAFCVAVANTTLPTDPRSWPAILIPLARRFESTVDAMNPPLIELKSIITALSHLPATTDLSPEQVEERQREKEVIKRRLNKLISHHPTLSQALDQELLALNGVAGDPRSFDALETFLNRQPYRLSFWRVANEEINYRRFFDVFEFIGMRTEQPEVFESTHALLFSWIDQQLVQGVRIDHIDGLWDPTHYLQHLTERLNQTEGIYVIVEKILMGNETLVADWPVHGSVGYDFLTQLNGLYLYQGHKNDVYALYRRLTDLSPDPTRLAYTCKRLILSGPLSSELGLLARILDRISSQHRHSRDFTEESLKSALRDVIASFPVYRSYMRPGIQEVREEDRRSILFAVAQAKKHNPTFNSSLFDFIYRVLLLDYYPGLTERAKEEWIHFVWRFQQLTGPVMAKGVEDTAFYRFYPIPSLMEVGTPLRLFGVTSEQFHKKNKERLEKWPHSMLASSTHDTKRSEDVRARLNVLSEIPPLWERAIGEWMHLNRPHRLVEEEEECIPDANEEYLFYATLVGTWPLYPLTPAEHLHYTERIEAYMLKAIKEAKLHTSWINPNEMYEQGVQQFMRKALSLGTEENPFLSSFKQFIPPIISAGMLNSLSQLVLKLTSPGVPDIYQGNELWNFTLVDPDNRSAVDFSSRHYFLNSLDKLEKQLPTKELLAQLMKTPEDGKIKMWVTTRLLHLRHRLAHLFAEGSYQPLTIRGEKQEHLIAFARYDQAHTLLVIVGRFFSSLLSSQMACLEPKIWHDHLIEIPATCPHSHFRSLYTGEQYAVEGDGDSRLLSLEHVLEELPIAVLEGIVV